MEKSSSFSCYKIEQEQKGCYNEWMNLQSKHILDLKNTLLNNNNNNIIELIDHIIKDFEDYAAKRYEICHERCSSSYFAPPWNSSLENALLWIGGCRPSSFIRIIYSLCGSQIEKFQLHDDAQCSSTHGFRSMSDLTADQIKKINEIHMKIVKEEDEISRKVASKQEDVADLPIAIAVYADDSEDDNIDIDLDKYEEKMANLMVEADKLRIKTLKNIVNVLNPFQAAEFLLAGKRFHVKLHEWGKVREERRGGCSPAAAVAAGGRAAGV